MRITVTWMNGQQETYDCPDYRIEGGVLYLDPSLGGLDQAEPRRVIPLHNIQIFTE